MIVQNFQKDSGNVGHENNSDSYVATIKTKITNEYKDINQKYLVKLGSLGLSNRIEIIRNLEEIK